MKSTSTLFNNNHLHVEVCSIVSRDYAFQIPPTSACSRALMKMMYCPHCHGLTRTLPCSNFCLNTMKGCLAYHAELNLVWNEYIGK